MKSSLFEVGLIIAAVSWLGGMSTLVIAAGFGGNRQPPNKALAAFFTVSLAGIAMMWLALASGRY